MFRLTVFIVVNGINGIKQCSDFIHAKKNALHRYDAVHGAQRADQPTKLA
jgi:hypothetical protein